MAIEIPQAELTPVLSPAVGDPGYGHNDGGGVVKAARDVRGTEAPGAQLRQTRVGQQHSRLPPVRIVNLL